MRSTLELWEMKTSLYKYLDTKRVFGKLNILFYISGPLVLLDIPYTKRKNRIAQEKRNKEMLENPKYKLGQRVIATLMELQLEYQVKADIRKIEVMNNELVYYLTLYFDDSHLPKGMSYWRPVREKDIKPDRKYRINKLYGN